LYGAPDRDIIGLSRLFPPLFKKTNFSTNVLFKKLNRPGKYRFLMADIEDVFPKFYIFWAGEMKEKAFTLVEVILVVTILGILAALVMPTFGGHSAEAR